MCPLFDLANVNANEYISFVVSKMTPDCFGGRASKPYHPCLLESFKLQVPSRYGSRKSLHNSFVPVSRVNETFLQRTRTNASSLMKIFLRAYKYLYVRVNVDYETRDLIRMQIITIIQIDRKPRIMEQKNERIIE